jgi:hypothetical protein
MTLCPNCHDSEGVREAKYGLHSFEPDYSEYFVAVAFSVLEEISISSVRIQRLTG